jgi:hypothetical protein
MKMWLRPLGVDARGERGAVLVHFAVATVALVAFTALTIDYGVMWMSRRQAQNAADAGALAGAMSLAFDDPTGFNRARDMARGVGRTNLVFGLQPDIDRVTDVSFPTGSPDCTSSYGVPDTCVKVDVYRNQTKDPLPTFFARVWGRTEQGVRATATAQIRTGNATDCLKPWVVADKWSENWNGPANSPWNPAPGEWTPETTFDKYCYQGNTAGQCANNQNNGNTVIVNPAITAPDAYVPPTQTGATGFRPYNPNGTMTADYGFRIELNVVKNSTDLPMVAGWTLPVILPGTANNGGAGLRDNIWGCNETVFAIGDELAIDTTTGEKIGPIRQAVEGGGPVPIGLIQQDPQATWNATTRTVENSCAPGPCPWVDGTTMYRSFSPRIVPVALFDIDEYYRDSPSGKSTVKIQNIAGLFVEGIDNKNAVYGRLVAFPGLNKAGSGSVPLEASFLRDVILVR